MPCNVTPCDYCSCANRDAMIQPCLGFTHSYHLFERQPTTTLNLKYSIDGIDEQLFHCILTFLQIDLRFLNYYMYFSSRMG